MKPVETYDKLRGGYYTPEDISSFITRWAVRSANETVLEPSCGDGSFLKAASERFRQLGTTPSQIKKNIIGIEYDETEARKAEKYGTQVVCDDFFTYYEQEIDGKRRFDVILGNPPFIRYQSFKESFRVKAFSLMKKYGFNPNRLTNIWIPFLLLSCESLKPNGRIGMVIPAELFQVNYAKEARNFLTGYFNSLSIITFKKLVFDGIQQEIVILLAEKNGKVNGLRFIELENLSDLINCDFCFIEHSEVKTMIHNNDKWVKYYLTAEELDLLENLDMDNRIFKADSLYETNVGLVSGENEFFVVNSARVEKFKIQDYITPIISRSDQVKGVVLREKDYDSLVESGKKVYLFDVGNYTFDMLSSGAKNYISWGEQQGFNLNYKCQIRSPWYRVPVSWKADAFLIRQANEYPKMILNQKNALVTDTLHKVRFADGVDGRTVTAAFMNSYTFALSETLGRSYGGGVLTFEPSEMRQMRIPMAGSKKLDLDQIDDWQRTGSIDKILSYTDDILLREGLGLSQHEISLLHCIWTKMRDRRLSRKRSSLPCNDSVK